MIFNLATWCNLIIPLHFQTFQSLRLTLCCMFSAKVPPYGKINNIDIKAKKTSRKGQSIINANF